jgi:hypothetical protein
VRYRRPAREGTEYAETQAPVLHSWDPSTGTQILDSALLRHLPATLFHQEPGSLASIVAINSRITKLTAVHMTERGTVRLEARRHAGAWLALFRAPGLKLAHRFRSASDACCYLHISFSRYFPEHSCTAACHA